MLWRLRRATWVLIGFLAAVPLALYSVHYLRTPLLYAQDLLERRVCRECSGSGRDEELAETVPELGGRCPACRGGGEVDVIIPGPNRPTKLSGLVLDASTLDFFGGFERLRARRGGPPEGAVPGARIAFTPEEGEPRTLEANPFGRFTLALAPGEYEVRVEAEGFRPLEADLEVPELTEPIWLEKARIIREPRTAAEARSLYGLQAVVTLAREGEGTLEVRPGGP